MQNYFKLYKQTKQTLDYDVKQMNKVGINTFTQLPSKPVHKNVCFSIFFIKIVL